MKRFAREILLFLTAGAAGLAQPPAIFQDGVLNAASRMPASLAGGALAPGSLITINGVRLFDAVTGARVETRIGESTRNLRVLSSSVDLIQAQLPADLPTGKVQLTVFNQAGASLPYEVTVVPASFGIFGTNGKGFGPGRIWNISGKGERTLNSSRVPAMPGQGVVLEGTGLGAARTPEILIGGKGVSGAISIVRPPDRPGIDQLSFTLPVDVPGGCFVPLVIRLPGGPVSNVVTLAVLSSGHECEPVAGFPGRLREPGNVGFLVLARTQVPVEGVSAKDSVNLIADHGLAGFTREIPGGEVGGPFRLIPPAGTCTAYTPHLGVGLFISGLPALVGSYAPEWLDAGPRISVHGPRGEKALPKEQEGGGMYQGTLGGTTPQMPRSLPPFLEPGRYSVGVSGGADVGSFSSRLDPPADFKWTNDSADRTIDRSRGFTVTWRARGARQMQMLIAAMGVDQLTTAAGLAVCVVPASAGRFFVPPETLANIPPSQAVPGIPMDYLFVAAWEGRYLPAPPSLTQLFGASVLIRGETVKFR